MSISPRSRTVLSQVVTLHYRTCGPVGSALVSKTRNLSCSPATIRNVMMRLESSGHLSQPHTSAGRLPTDLGYRTYVNGIKLGADQLEPFDQEHMVRCVGAAPTPISALKIIADYVHLRTGLLTFNLPFRHQGFRLGHMHLERLNAKRLLALWVARGGQTFQSILEIPEHELAGSLVETTSNFFNNTFHNKNLVQIQGHLRQRYGHGGRWDALLSSAARVVHALLEEIRELEPIQFQGISRILEMPEFEDVAQVRSVCKIVEQQEQIGKLVKRCLEEESKWLMFFIGGEMNDPELENMTLVLSKFHTRDEVIGCVGALGPKRMPYLYSLQMFRFAQEQMTAAGF